MIQMYYLRILLTVLLVFEVKCFLLDNIETLHFYVSPHGSDRNAGRDVNHPVQTLHKAVSHIHEVSNKGKNIIIELMAGYHDLKSTLRITHTDGRKVTIRAFQDQKVHVTGGKRIPSNSFHAVTDNQVLQRLPTATRTKVLQVKLNESGITNLGMMSEYGFYIHRTAPLEIFENGKPFTLARFPNHEYINIVSVPPNSGDKTFIYDSDRPRNWHHEDDLWVHGFWYWSWADRAVKVNSINPMNNSLTLSQPGLFGLRPGHYNASNPAGTGFTQQGGYFKFVNVFSELDEPGEYYVDRSQGILYLWPMSGTPYKSSDVIYASVLDICIDVSRYSKNIIFKGFVIEACRQNAIHGRNLQNVTLTNMQVRNTGSYGIVFQDSTDIKISRCHISYTDGGIFLSGGNRNTLTPSGNDISDNSISHFGRRALVGMHGIHTSGVGSHVHHNVLWRGTYLGIGWAGNDHIFEYNQISEMCMNASDCGAMMVGRDWTERGNIIRYNHIHDTKRMVPGADVRGIMLDDEFSGAVIHNNVFFDNDVHVNIGGGRDNIIHQNIFYNALQYSMQVDARGKSGQHNATLMQRLHNNVSGWVTCITSEYYCSLVGCQVKRRKDSKIFQVPYTNSLWSHRYPKLAQILSNTPEHPEGNQITQNIFYYLNKELIHGLGHSPSTWFNVTDNAFAPDENNFYAPTYGNYKPQCLLNDFVSRTHFPNPVLPDQIGPRYPVGPKHIVTETPNLGYKKGAPPSPTLCATNAPLTAPTHAYLPDGSAPNTIYNVSKSGCWFVFDKCPNHPELQRDHRTTSGIYYRDLDAEKHDSSGTSESACLGKVGATIQKCGTHSLFSIIYGPTGAMALGGEGCYMAMYGCPTHGNNFKGITRDGYAESHQNATVNEEGCLSRALAQWRWCGSPKSYPVVSIFRPTGNTRVAGPGCWIKIERCPNDSSVKSMFYDGWGAANLHTDEFQATCFDRAKTFWRQCGSYPQYRVTAFYRPNARSFTYP